MFRAIFRVCAEFKTNEGKVNVGRDDLLTIREYPDAIKKCVLFKLLEKDGSVETVQGREQQKKIENEPDKDVMPDGKKKKEPKPEAAETPKKAEEAKKPDKTEKSEKPDKADKQSK